MLINAVFATRQLGSADTLTATGDLSASIRSSPCAAGEREHISMVTPNKNLANSSQANMAEPRMEKVKQSLKRVFINNIDSYASKYIAKVNIFKCGMPAMNVKLLASVHLI